MKALLRLSGLLVVFVAAFAAQSATPPAVASRIAAVAAARDAAKVDLQQGNSEAAIARLRAAASRSPRAPAEDTQVISQLCLLARELEAGIPGSGRSAALAAISEGQRSSLRLPRREAAYVETQLGDLRERTLGDHTGARTHYEAALRHDPTAASARRGLERLAWRDALIATKSRENQALRQRAK